MLHRLFLLIVTAFLLCSIFSYNWSRKLEISFAENSSQLYFQSSGRYKKSAGRTSQNIQDRADIINADYSFLNFNRDKIKIHFEISRKALKSYLSGYGYSDADTEKLNAECKQLRDGVYSYAVKKGYSQEQYNGMAKGIENDCKEKKKRFMNSRGFRVLPGNYLEADMPEIVRRNVSQLKSVAGAFQNVADQLDYGSEDIVGAVTSMVQTAIEYRIPPSVQNGIHTGGILPPVKSMVSGWGDCDTKTGLLASILGNWNRIKMAGIAVPKHYLMGIQRIPGKGDMYVEHEGIHYVLIEPAGPAWLVPGSVGTDTVPLLQSGEGFRIQPFLM